MNDIPRTPAFAEGQDAGAQGLTDADCPYPIGSDKAMDWQDGLADVDASANTEVNDAGSDA
jgi:hypothetical protein